MSIASRTSSHSIYSSAVWLRLDWPGPIFIEGNGIRAWSLKVGDKEPGVIKGAGLGLIYYCNGSTGGMDIVVKFLRQKYSHINFGTIMLTVDTAVVVAYAMVLGQYQSAMYSIIAMFVVTKVVDLFLYGIDNSALCFIISDQSARLTDEILSGTVHRGVTILEGEGAYSHAEKHVVMCVVKRTQLPELRRLVKGVDEHAFFVVTDAKNVFGKGFESISEVR